MSANSASRRIFVGATALLLATGTLATAAAAQTLDQRFWGTDGNVSALARAGNTLYIGGSFSTVGPCTGGGVPVEPETGAPVQGFPRVTGRVRTAAPDGDGGWYIGGTFTAVEGIPRMNVAHILANGEVSPWDPKAIGAVYSIRPRDPNATDVVSALVVRGHVVYAGGTFTMIGGQPRACIAALDVSTGAATAWNPNADHVVTAIAASGRTIYVCGWFNNIGGQARNGIAALDARTGAATPWNPNANARVLCLAIGQRTVFAGGEFDSIGGQPRNSIAALDIETGKATAWDPHLSPVRQQVDISEWIWPYVAGLAVQGSTVYAGGSFDHVGGQPRQSLASLDVRSGRATEFNPAPDGYVSALVIGQHAVYVGGYFRNIGGQVRPNVAGLDPLTGAATAWNPRANGIVAGLAVAGNEVYVGGYFTSMYEWQARQNLAALDSNTGLLMDWNPGPDGPLAILMVKGNTLYVGGRFNTVAGEARNSAAAFNTFSGALTSWNPNASNDVRAMTEIGDAIYLGGDFASLGGQPRNGLAAVDATSGMVLPWSPDLGNPYPYVTVMGSRGNTLYVGGSLYSFQRNSTLRRNSLLALDVTTGVWSEWNPNPGPPYLTTNQIGAMSLDEGLIYVGGNFNYMGGQPRSGLLAVDTTLGAASSWNPSPSGPYTNYAYMVAALAPSNGVVFVGGAFDSIGGKARGGLAAVDTGEGLATAWDPNCTAGLDSCHAVVDALLLDGDALYVGGGFEAMSELPRSGLAVFNLAQAEIRKPVAVPLAPLAERLMLAEITPNPARVSTLVRFSLPVPAVTSFAVFDISGRRIKTLLDRQLLPAGDHTIQLHVFGWQPGIYWCRLDAGQTAITNKVVVVR